MRMRSTIERRRDRYEFIYRHREELARLMGADARDQDVRDFVEKVARPELTYGPRTYYFDIYMTLRRDWPKVFFNNQ